MTLINPSCLTCKTRSCSLLDKCSNEVLKEISDKKIFRKIKRGETLFAEGKEAVHIAFVKSGVLKVQLNGKKNRPLILRLAKEGDVLGHRTGIQATVYPETVVAIEQSQICLLPVSRFIRMMETCADFRKEIIQAYLHDLLYTEKKAIELVHQSVKEKLAGILLYIAEVYKYHRQPNGIHIHLSRQEMADLSGTTKEQVSKILADFKKEKWINFRAKHFKFIDIEKLKKLVSSAACVD